MSPQINSYIEEWKRKLIDLTRRNRLLFFGPTRSSSVQVIEPSPNHVFQRLVVDERPWKFFVPPEEDEQQNSDSVRSDPPPRAAIDQAIPRSRRGARTDELLSATRDAKTLRAILRNLYRRSRTDFEERGVRILYVAFGILEWREVEQSEVVRSPILLVPAELKRDSVNDPFELRAADEEIVINPALEVRLRKDFRLDLPPLAEDWEESNLDSYLSKIDAQVRRRGWSVSSECWIGLFSFHKLVIYQDLNSHHGLIEQHPILISLCNRESPDIVGGNLPDPRELDSRIDPRDSYLVLDADSSQLACIEAVKGGVHMLIQGPPGTGKSQTISNIIAESIAAGKTVLFMSEKMAALEMVYKRVLDKNLGHFCLELHSHKANKREVVAELYRCYRESLEPPRGVMTEREFLQLTERRRQLNECVHALHLMREPLGKSVYEVLGELAQLERVPFVSPGDVDPKTLTQERLHRTEQLAQHLSQLWVVAAEGDRFPWIGCTTGSYSLETRATFQRLVSVCEKVVRDLAEEGKRFGAALGLPSPTCLAETEWILRTGELLREGPGVPEDWLLTQEFDSFISQARQYNELSARWRTLRGSLTDRYDERFFELPLSLSEKLRRLLRMVSAYLARDILSDPALVSRRRELLGWVQNLIQRLGDWTRDGNVLLELLGLASSLTIDELKRLVAIAVLCKEAQRPDAGWLDPLRLDQVAELLPRLRREYETRARKRSQLLEEYDESFLALDVDLLMQDLSQRYSSPLRWLKPGFYRLRRQVRRCRRDGRVPPDIMRDLLAARDLRRLEAKMQSEAERGRGLLGHWYRGYETNFSRVEEALGVARRLLNLVPTRPVPRQLIDHVCIGAVPSDNLIMTATRLTQSLGIWEGQSASLYGLLPVDHLPSSVLPLAQSGLQDVLNWANGLLEPLETAVSYLDAVESSLRSPATRSPGDILADLDALASLHDLESQVQQESVRLQAIYRERFVGLQTGWENILAALDWAKRLRDHFAGRAIPQLLLEKARVGANAAPSLESLTERISLFREAFDQFERHFEQAYPQLEGTPIRACAFEALRVQLGHMYERVDGIRDWVDFRAVREEFRQAGLSTFFAGLTRPSMQPETLQGVVRRALLQAWVDWVFQQEPTLGRFRGHNHDALIAEFCDLDRKHWKLGAYRVISQANRRRPRSDFVVPGGEEQVLIREANKQRRHLPIRRLFAQVPNLLTRLKPCLLMSPLSVSQFLDPDQIKFDLVIFDEASQIRTEDAVGAIYRGRQLVVCGDNRQLPPTAFFEQGMSEEYDDEDVEEAFDVFPSILEQCASIGMAEGWLRWHYRSRHESLIAFSNHHFYDNRLVTFPASRDKDPRLGIEFRYVPDGVYDRGGRRDNPKEADVIAGLVTQHFRKHPDRSLGVVAFSLAQMNAIEDRIEQLLREHPELQRYFKEDRLEGFFVKNLENVQGDERDVIIFSVGYGKDQQGRLTMHFGPLNRLGGERRLNVVVTRAREKVILVSSIRAADFDLSAIQAPGVLHLYRYIDYAERGPQALKVAPPGPPGEFESPLEREVAAVIRALGYHVVPQVGCSGFRIDLGIVDPAQPGRFLLGVECDGASYHSGATARDRDRLRQEVLEKLGWRIYRVWSPDWIMRRDTEVRRLREAIERARTALPIPEGANSPPAEEIRPPIVRPLPMPADQPHNLPRWVNAYKVCRVKARPPGGIEFHDPAARQTLVQMLREVVEAEGPVHIEVATRRLVSAWGLTRAGRRIREAVRSAFNSLKGEGKVRRIGKFLWPSKVVFELTVRQPDPEDEDTLREIGFIPQEELELAVMNAVRDALSISEDDLVKAVARIFGFDRTGVNIRGRMETIFRQMTSRGMLVLKGDRISLSPGRI